MTSFLFNVVPSKSLPEEVPSSLRLEHAWYCIQVRLRDLDTLGEGFIPCMNSPMRKKVSDPPCALASIMLQGSEKSFFENICVRSTDFDVYNAREGTKEQPES